MSWQRGGRECVGNLLWLKKVYINDSAKGWVIRLALIYERSDRVWEMSRRKLYLTADRDWCELFRRMHRCHLRCWQGSSEQGIAMTPCQKFRKFFSSRRAWIAYKTLFRYRLRTNASELQKIFLLIFKLLGFCLTCKNPFQLSLETPIASKSRLSRSTVYRPPFVSP